MLIEHDLIILKDRRCRNDKFMGGRMAQQKYPRW
ncbi:hypothetical protein LCGC14_0365310 [marine sediment metagenome]|uniref:Uncharacterized protein n=1 Tax=marine sediment metagenome TaxID=412755 RepID=A0A0F9T6N9_9ZZZZ